MDAWDIDGELKDVEGQISIPSWVTTAVSKLSAINDFIDAINDSKIIYRTSWRMQDYKTPSDLEDTIESLRPITADKIDQGEDGEWGSAFIKLADNVQMMRVQTQEDIDLINQRIDESVIPPPFTTDGLVGFNYPSSILPSLVDVESGTSDDLPDEGTEEYRMDTSAAFNSDATDSVLGGVQSMSNLTSSPYSSKSNKGWCCDGKLKLKSIKIPSLFQLFNKLLSKLKLPSFPKANNSLKLNKCISRHIPTLFMPKNKISKLSLGGGKEVGLVQNGNVVSSNFGTGFNSLDSMVSSMTNSTGNLLKSIDSAIASSVNSVLGSTNSVIKSVATKAAVAAVVYGVATGKISIFENNPSSSSGSGSGSGSGGGGTSSSTSTQTTIKNAVESTVSSTTLENIEEAVNSAASPAYESNLSALTSQLSIDPTGTSGYQAISKNSLASYAYYISNVDEPLSDVPGVVSSLPDVEGLIYKATQGDSTALTNLDLVVRRLDTEEISFGIKVPIIPTDLTELIPVDADPDRSSKSIKQFIVIDEDAVEDRFSEEDIIRGTEAIADGDSTELETLAPSKDTSDQFPLK